MFNKDIDTALEDITTQVNRVIASCDELLNSPNAQARHKKFAANVRGHLEEFLKEEESPEEYQEEKPQPNEHFEHDCRQRVADIKDTQEKMKGNL
jgi:hypothetical protein